MPFPEVKTTIRDSLLIAAAVAFAAVLLWLSGADAALARLLYYPSTTNWAWTLRQWGAWIGGVSAAIGLVLCVVPGLWRRQPLVYRSALVLVLTVMFGVGLVNQVVIKDLAHRPRPRESVLAGETLVAGEISGNSLPSGHAGMAGVLVAPYFVLRKRKKRLAEGFLLAGLTAGVLVGVSRMSLGAHFASDVVSGVGIDLVVARLAAGLVEQWQRVPEWAALALVLAAAWLMVWMNRFEMTLGYAGAPFNRVELPGGTCGVLPGNGAKIVLSGFGAPLSQLALVNEGGVLRVQTRYGVYHHLRCKAGI